MENIDEKKIFANNLKRFMKIYEKTQYDLSKDLDVATGTISEWCNGNKYPRSSTMLKLADYFNVTLADLVDEPKLNRTNRIPVFSKIPAGVPIELIEDVIDFEELADKYFIGDKEYFGVKVEGNSMNPKYLDGDILIVQKQSDCESGQDCIVMVNSDDGTFKRVIKMNNGITLQPLNPDYEMKFFTNEEINSLPVRILGVVKEIRRTI